MHLSFVETMGGTVKDARSAAFPLSFEVNARGGEAGRFTLRGIVKAPPWAPETAAQGTLVIAPRARTITYVLRFVSDAGDALTLDAQKRFSFFSPMRSMTFMPVTVSDGEGQVRARGDLSFDLRTLGPFLFSWLPISRVQRKRLDVRRRAVARAQLRGT